LSSGCRHKEHSRESDPLNRARNGEKQKSLMPFTEHKVIYLDGVVGLLRKSKQGLIMQLKP